MPVWKNINLWKFPCHKRLETSHKIHYDRQVRKMGSSFGFVIGLMVAAVLIVLISKIANKDGKIRTEYDERQQTVRGKAYMYAFYAECAAQAVIMCLLMSGMELPVEPYALIFAGIIVGCTALAGYCVWNDVYWGLNNNRRRYNMVIAAGIVLNMLPVAGAVYGGTLIENGKLGMAFINISVLLMIAVIFVLRSIKSLISSKEETDG